MADVFDYKKAYKDLYAPIAKPSVIDVPEMVFIMADGKSDPNTSAAYQNAVGALYSLSYSIKMSKMSGGLPDGYFEYVVPPLEGLWWFEEGTGFNGGPIPDKSKFCWTSMIRQPEFVTVEVFERAKNEVIKKKPELDLGVTRLARFTEGLCVQIMHIGPYDDEPATVRVMEDFIIQNGYKKDFSETRKHHEIYLGDPRKTAPEKLRTIIRHPIAKQ
jgi:hypothetical protein